MHEMTRSPRLKGFGLMLAVMALFVGRATADVTTDQPGSIVVFPKVIADGTRDTLIELTNTGNLQQYVHCFYIPSTGYCSQTASVSCMGDSDCPTNEECSFSHRDFGLVLTRQQPTIWRVSTGRTLNALDPVNGACASTCDREHQACDPNSPTSCPEGDSCVLSGSSYVCEDTHASCSVHSDCDSLPGDFCEQSCPGTDPGNILAMGEDFRGELICLLAESDGLPVQPVGANCLKGEAVIETITPLVPDLQDSPIVGQLSKYNGIAIQAVDGGANLDDVTVEDSTQLQLDNYQYNACPAALWFEHLGSDASDPVVSSLTPADCTSSGCPVRTEITLVPCTIMLETERVPGVPVGFDVYDEIEEVNSVDAVPVYRWFNADLGQSPFWAVTVGRGDHLMTKVSPATDATGGFPAAVCFDGINIGGECTSDADCSDATRDISGLCAPSPAFLGVVEEFHQTDGTLAQTLTLLDATNATTMHMVPGRTGRCGNNMAQTCAGPDDAACPQNCVMDVIEIPLQ